MATEDAPLARKTSGVKRHRRAYMMEKIEKINVCIEMNRYNIVGTDVHIFFNWNFASWNRPELRSVGGEC